MLNTHTDFSKQKKGAKRSCLHVTPRMFHFFLNPVNTNKADCSIVLLRCYELPSSPQPPLLLRDSLVLFSPSSLSLLLSVFLCRCHFAGVANRHHFQQQKCLVSHFVSCCFTEKGFEMAITCSLIHPLTHTENHAIKFSLLS